MRKILGLDIGVGSIGWAYLHEPENESEQYSIIRMGSRIIPLNSDESDEFTKGNAISKNANRRIKRGMRRGGHRYKMRKWKLVKLLTELNMQPTADLFKLNSLELYGLRAKAIETQIGLEELGRIFYHLNQKRGYKSNRKANNEEEKAESSNNTDKDGEVRNPKKKGYLDLINDRELFIKDSNLTIGQFFYNHLKENHFFRIKENIFLRSSYQAEFNKIWEKQKEYYPEILTDENYTKLFHKIIYFQRPLKSQKGLVSSCRFEQTFAKDKQGNILKDETGNPKIIRPKVVPKSSPLFQIAKVWQDINNLSIKTKTGIAVEIPIEQKQQLFQYLNENEKITVTNLKKMLGLKPAEDFYINLKKDSLEGNKTVSAIKKALKGEREEVLQFNLLQKSKLVANQQTGEAKEQFVIEPDFEKEPLYRLWHLLYSVEEVESLVKNLQEDFSFTLDQAKALAKLDFTKAGYGGISTKAYRKILPHLMNGLHYSKACDAAGYRHSDYLTLSENESRPLLDKLELYSKNSLRNPVVEKIINQVINLVNAIIADETLGKPDEIRVELGRELKQNAEERNNTYSRNNKTNDRHQKIAERLHHELGFATVSRRDIERVKLWEEFGGVSPYEPTKPISLNQLFNGDYEIEHIIPRSRFFDDSFSNKTIARKKFNADKDNTTAFDYIQNLGEQEFHNYTEFVKKHFYKKEGISRAKLNYLLMPGDKIPDDFINRQMRDTAYISREVKNLLLNICRNVYSTSGSVTDYLRENWGINNVLQQLNFEKYKAAGQTELKKIKREDGSTHEIEVISNWSKRDDHRHHAIDALVVALTKQSFIQKLNQLNQQYKTRRDLKENGRRFPEPWKGFVNDAMEATDNILVSFKAGKKVATKNINHIKKGKEVIKVQETLTPRGKLNEDFIYGKIKQYNRDSSFSEEIVIKYKLGAGQGMLFDGNETVKTKEKIDKKTGEKIIVEKDQIKVKLDSIVDFGVRSIVEKRLLQFNNNVKEAFKTPLWLNEEKGIQIKSVRCKTNLTKVKAIHYSLNGQTFPLKNNIKIPDGATLIDFIKPGNNHHIAIYKDKAGTTQENAVTFGEAIERKIAGVPVIIKKPVDIWDKILNTEFDCSDEVKNNLPLDNWELITSLQQNELFIYGLSFEDISNAIENNMYNLLSKHLYRIQNIAPGQYFLRHHLETKDLRDKKAREMKKLIQLSSASFNAHKVRVNCLGKIIKIGD
ncbi:MAG: type II CRISPR RNA-guided endonuclease Cas9 [Chitinophagaceae bacterium]|nr:type II CRISPR RNA-guided endonuclease Cas9 [Chitinophagaceae bacterium]